MADTIISIHIPKTGGTTFKEVLIAVSGNRVYFDYEDKPLSSDYRYRRLYANLRGLLRKRKDEIPEEARFIHGHFLASKYEKRFPRARFIVWFRDPVERLISHYHFWLREPDMDNATCRRMIIGKMSLLDFAALKEMRNVHSRFLSGKDLDTFDFIGITEEYDKSLRLFKKMFFSSIDMGFPIRNENPNRRGRSYEIDEDTRRAIMEYNRLDLDLYERARKRFDSLCGIYDVD